MKRFTYIFSILLLSTTIAQVYENTNDVMLEVLFPNGDTRQYVAHKKERYGEAPTVYVWRNNCDGGWNFSWYNWHIVTQ